MPHLRRRQATSYAGEPRYSLLFLGAVVGFAQSRTLPRESVAFYPLVGHGMKLNALEKPHSGMNSLLASAGTRRDEDSGYSRHGAWPFHPYGIYLSLAHYYAVFFSALFSQIRFKLQGEVRVSWRAMAKHGILKRRGEDWRDIEMTKF